MATCNINTIEKLLAFIREQDPGACRHWFEEIQPIECVDGVLTLFVDEPVRLKYLERCCCEQFTRAARSTMSDVTTVRFVDEHQPGAELVNGDVTSGGFTHSGYEEDMLLSPNHTFDNFVVGPDNRLAHAASVAVSKKPALAYNPLFIHGGVGLGKTHLLQAICRTSMENHPSLRIYYTSCNGFMTQFLDAVQEGGLSSFRHRFRSYDLLVIDDIHDLSKRGPSQEEFFHTFNSLYQAGRQIVLSSDAPPNDIPELEERLISRFNCGLVANVERPCYETRVAIIKSKARIRNLTLPDDVSSYIAAKIDTNIREIEGAITKLEGLSLVNNSPINLSLAKKAIGERSRSRGKNQLSIQGIIEAITSYFDLKLADLLSKRRNKSIALPRQIGMYLARKHTRFSLEEIGGYFGGRDHTTVMHAVRTIDQRRSSDARLDRDLIRLEELLVGHDLELIGQPA